MNIEIIPAIDLLGGECVRLTKGAYDSSKTYSSNPVEIAKSYADKGFRRLHIVDLDGAREQKPQNLRILEKIASATKLEIQYGGGIKSESSLNDVLSSGAKRAICGSIAVTNPTLFEQWLKKFGSEKIILGADVKGRNIAINGWMETSKTDISTLIKQFPTLTQVICTDIAKDGMLTGPNFELYDNLQQEFPDTQITVSGGISSLDDIKQLDSMKLRSVIVGKAIYEKCIQLDELC